MTWQTKASGDAKTIPNITLGPGNYRLVLDLPGLPLVGNALANAAAVLAKVIPGATHSEVNGNTVYVYFQVGGGGGAD